MVQRVGNWMGALWYRRIRFRKEVVFSNLRRAFPKKSEEEIQTIALGTFQQLAKSTIEFFRIPLLKDKTYLHSLVQIKTGENLFQEVVKSGKGGILVSGHFGNFEMAAAALAALDYPIAGVEYEQHNKWIHRLIEKYHTSMGVEVIRKQNARKRITNAIIEGKIVGFLPDQDAGENGIFVKYFGIDSSTAAGPASYALKLNVPIICGYTVRTADGTHHLLLRQLDMSGLTGDINQDIITITQRHTSLLEEFVRIYPDHWYWIHKRWKRQPKSQKNQASSTSE